MMSWRIKNIRIAEIMVVPMIIAAYSMSNDIIWSVFLVVERAKFSIAAIAFFTYRGIKSENTRDIIVIKIPKRRWYLYLKKYLRTCFKCAIFSELCFLLGCKNTI